MKQILSLALALLPCLAWAQYPSNGNQKITLGEQTTADGLIFRGVAADTSRKPSVDTMAYILLDTSTNRLWHYKKATSNAWLSIGTDTTSLNLVSRFAAKLNISDTASMLTNYYRSGRAGIIQASDVPTLNQNTTGSAATLTTSRTFQTNLASTSTASFNGSANVTPGVTGTLPVANGGTGSATQNFVDLTTAQTINGLKTFGNDLSLKPSSGYTIMTQESPNVSHGVTGWLPNNAYSSATIEDTNNGGFSFVSATDAATPGALNFYGIMGSTSPTSNAIIFSAAKKNGTSIQKLADAENAMLFRNYGGSELLQFKGNGAATFSILAGSGSRAVNADANGSITAASSILIKENVENINYGLSDVLKLKPVIFNYIDRNKWGEGKDLGFVAEDVMNVIPEATGVMNSSDIYFDLQKLIPVLTKAIQEQQALIKALEQRIINLENK